MINLSEYKRIHCIGIGGIGLSAVAEIFMSRGYMVSGSDMRESDITEKLMDGGARIFWDTEPRMWRMPIWWFIPWL